MPEGKVFTGWEGNVEFANADAASTTFVMPANNVNVTANFEDKVYAVTVNGESVGVMTTNLGGKLSLSVEMDEGKTV